MSTILFLNMSAEFHICSDVFPIFVCMYIRMCDCMCIYLPRVLSVGMSLTNKLTDRYVHRMTNVHMQIVRRRTNIHTKIHIQTNRHIDRQTYAYRQTFRSTLSQANRQTNRKTKGRQTYSKMTYIHIDMHTHTCRYIHIDR